MKKIFFVIMLFCTSAVMAQNEQTTAVLQHGDVVSVFKGVNALVDAYTAAEAGDVITLSSGSFTATTIAKSVSVYGAGCVDDAENGVQQTRILSGFAVGLAEDTLQNIRFEGVYIQGALDFIANSPIEEMVISKCWINGNLNFNSNITNVTISQSQMGTITGIRTNTADNLLIRNCVVSGVIQQFALSSSVVIDHCIIGGTTNKYTDILACFTYTNDIFSATSCGRDEYFFARSGSTLDNCVYPNNTCWTSMAGDVVLRNCFDVDKNSIFSDTENFIITQPETWIGNDGTEIGVHGGLGWNRLPSTPVVKNLQLEVSGNTLNVTYDAEVR